MQFSYFGVQIYNLHILLFIWSAFIGVIIYAEVLTWYLLKGTITKPVIQGAPAAGGSSQKHRFPDLRFFWRSFIKYLKVKK